MNNQNLFKKHNNIKSMKYSRINMAKVMQKFYCKNIKLCSEKLKDTKKYTMFMIKRVNC